MLHNFEVRGTVPGVGTLSLVIRAYSQAAASQAFLAQYPNGTVGFVKQID
jgi:hypothetical protein